MNKNGEGMARKLLGIPKNPRSSFRRLPLVFRRKPNHSQRKQVVHFPGLSALASEAYRTDDAALNSAGKATKQSRNRIRAFPVPLLAAKLFVNVVESCPSKGKEAICSSAEGVRHQPFLGDLDGHVLIGNRMLLYSIYVSRGHCLTGTCQLPSSQVMLFTAHLTDFHT